jgi:DNA-binding MarR family transcriptional regulator
MSISTVDGLAQLSFVVQAALERCAAEQDVSLAQTRLMGVLRDRTPTMNELAKLLGLDKSSVSGLVDRAERRGLVERMPSAADRRAITVSLTRVGRTLVTDVAVRFESEMAELVDGLGADQRETLTYLVSQVLVTHAAARGVDLFDTVASP